MTRLLLPPHPNHHFLRPAQPSLEMPPAVAAERKASVKLVPYTFIFILLQTGLAVQDVARWNRLATVGPLAGDVANDTLKAATIFALVVRPGAILQHTVPYAKALRVWLGSDWVNRLPPHLLRYKDRYRARCSHSSSRSEVPTCPCPTIYCRQRGIPLPQSRSSLQGGAPALPDASHGVAASRPPITVEKFRSAFLEEGENEKIDAEKEKTNEEEKSREGGL